jgi:predicted phosphodiesterase
MEENDIHTERRNFLKAGLALGAAALIAPTDVLASEQIKEDEFCIEVGPYLQTNFANEMSILWLTNKNATGWVMYGTEPYKLDKKAFGKSALGLKPANSKLNCVTITNLAPGQIYYYQLFSKEIKDFQPYKLTYGKTVNAAVEKFINADMAKDSISFLMLNDIHDRPESIPLLLNLDQEKNHDFVFFNGDIFNYQTGEQQIIDHMLRPCVDLFAKRTPFIYVRGNHETRGKFAREFPQYYKHVGYAAFTLGPVRFVILDTGEDKPDTEPVYADIVDFDLYREEQEKWLANEINTKAFKKAAFRIVMMHIPPRYSGDWHGATHCTKLFEPLLNRAKVDLVLSGHTHKYKVHLPTKGLNNYPLIIGGGPKDGARTLTKITTNSKQLTVSMIDDSGKEVGSYSAKSG